VVDGWWVVLFRAKMFLRNVRELFHSWINLPL
jgi:hypothetical protein